MKRELKFRVFDKQTKQMSPPFTLFGEFLLLRAVHAWQHECGNIATDSLSALNDLELMQYSGLKDKHGKIIYEGDLMLVLDRDWPSGTGDPDVYMRSIASICEVVFHNGCFQLLKRKGGNYFDLDLSREYGRDLFEVIGNIFQNPDLCQ